MKSIIFVLVWCFVIGLSSFHPFPLQNAIGLGIAALYISYFLWQKVHLSVGVAYLYYSILAAKLISFPQESFTGWDIATVVGFESNVAHAHLYLTMIVLAIALLRDDNPLEEIFMSFGLIESLMLIYKHFIGATPYFLLNNESIDVAFISCTIPLAYNWIAKKSGHKLVQLGFLMLYIFPCIYSKTSSGILGVGLGLSALLWASNGFKARYLKLAIMSGVVVAWVGYWMQGVMLIQGSGRYEIWSMAMDYWWTQTNRWLGTGAGTYPMIGLGLQVGKELLAGRDGSNVPGFFWLHSDLLQVLFETGIIGFVCMLIVYVIGIFKARRNPAIFAALISYGGISGIQMPTRHFLFAALGVFLLFKSFRTTEKYGSQ